MALTLPAGFNASSPSCGAQHPPEDAAEKGVPTGPAPRDGQGSLGEDRHLHGAVNAPVHRSRADERGDRSTTINENMVTVLASADTAHERPIAQPRRERPSKSGHSTPPRLPAPYARRPRRNRGAGARSRPRRAPVRGGVAAVPAVSRAVLSARAALPAALVGVPRSRWSASVGFASSSGRPCPLRCPVRRAGSAAARRASLCAPAALLLPPARKAAARIRTQGDRIHESEPHRSRPRSRGFRLEPADAI